MRHQALAAARFVAMATPAQSVRQSSDSRGLEGGKLLAGLGALLLLVSLFLDWYGAPRVGGTDGGDFGASAWTAFELVDLLLAALALATIAWAVAAFVRPGHDLLPARAGAVAGLVALVLVAVSIVNEPPLFFLADPSREIGIWLAFAGAVLITVGALLTTARISLVIARREASPGSPGTHAAGETAADRDQTAAYDQQAETRTLADDPASRVRRG